MQGNLPIKAGIRIYPGTIDLLLLNSTTIGHRVDKDQKNCTFCPSKSLTTALLLSALIAQLLPAHAQAEPLAMCPKELPVLSSKFSVQPSTSMQSQFPVGEQCLVIGKQNRDPQPSNTLLSVQPSPAGTNLWESFQMILNRIEKYRYQSSRSVQNSAATPQDSGSTQAKSPSSKSGDLPFGIASLQISYWEALGSRHPTKAKSLLSDLSSRICSGPFHKIIDHGLGGANDKIILALEDGTQAIFKPDSTDNDSNLERAAYEVDQLLGTQVVPYTVLATIDGKKGSLQLMIPKVHTLEPKPSHPKVPNFSHLQILDYIIGNNDRYNGGNLLSYGEKNRVIAIDNGAAFLSTDSLTDFYVNGSSKTSLGQLYSGGKTDGRGQIYRPGALVDFSKMDPQLAHTIEHLTPETVKTKLAPYMDAKGPQMTGVISRLKDVQNRLRTARGSR